MLEAVHHLIEVLRKALSFVAEVIWLVVLTVVELCCCEVDLEFTHFGLLFVYG